MLNNMNKIINLIVAFAALTFCFSCNNEWEDEQFAHYVGFKAPINSDGCTTVHVRYKTDGSTIKYQLPLVVSGSTVHTSDIEAIVELDADSLYTLNMKNIGERRKDIWYQDLSDNTNEYIGKDRIVTDFPAKVKIPAGESVALLEIEMDLEDLDQSWRWVLPLKVAEGKPGYTANTRKHYNNAMLHIVPFNDVSGSYSASTMLGWASDGNGNYPTDTSPYVTTEKTFYATGADAEGNQTAFFYAGNIDHTYKQRDEYRVDVTFQKTGGAMILTAPNPNLEFSCESANFSRSDVADPLKPYLVRKTTIIQAVYYMKDSTGGVPVYYKYDGSMTMQRTINTQIPDEDQAIQW